MMSLTTSDEQLVNIFLNELKQKNIPWNDVVYYSMIRFYMLKNEPQKMIQMYNTMITKGIQPDSKSLHRIVSKISRCALLYRCMRVELQEIIAK